MREAQAAMSEARGRLWAVVLAGGASRRFGSDKLEAVLDELTLLEHAIHGLPPAARLVLAGPDRDGLETDRPITYVREDPPGGGPAAAIVAGLRAVLEAGPADGAAAALDDVILVLPGDTPEAGEAAALLLRRLRMDPQALAVVGVDAAGREQPLQLALRTSAAQRLIEAAGPEAGRGLSARAIVRVLDSDLRRVPLSEDQHADIDTPADLDRWREQHP
jgi:molybdenum cofactor guanylyltransferase